MSIHNPSLGDTETGGSMEITSLLIRQSSQIGELQVH